MIDLCDVYLIMASIIALLMGFLALLVFLLHRENQKAAFSLENIFPKPH